ncbi:MAG TPA: M14 family zinc carboxypeptidase [Vicinamibacterales bacterium]|nr:M14 family zinc carboxypeptidase [Vicinamibacterales bacterium]
MNTHRRASRLLPLLVILTLMSPVAAQQGRPQKSSKNLTDQDLATAKPGRDPNQPIDEEYTKKIKEYTTEAFFLSPVVDYLPASKTVPTPKVVLGDIAGAPGKLPYSKEVYAYMRLLAKSTPRVKVFSIGTTEEGREMIAVAVASEALMAKLDSNKADLAKLADPRTIKMDDAAADEVARRAAPVYYITGTIHSTEAGAPTALMELAYRLAVDDSPYIRNIREHVITLITPVVEVDGRDRVVDAYEWKKKHPKDTPMAPVYWGHYVMHDNNRDAMGLTLKLSQNVLNTYLGWKAQVLHDLHESVALLYDNTIGNGPYNAWLDPILTNEWQMIGWNNVNEMTRMGMPGVFAWGTFDTWSPGYLMFMAATHNGISRLYETFGNGGSADTEERTLTPADTTRTWYRQNPAPSRVRWSLRNNNNYEQTGIIVSLNYVANNRIYFLRNFYDKSKRSIMKPKAEGPAAYVLPSDDPRPGAQAELVRVLQKQAVEISRATAPFTVTLPVKHPPAGAGRGGRGGRGGGAQAPVAPTPGTNPTAAPDQPPATPPAPQTREFPAGSYIVRMDQPYSRIADTLLDYQYWAPNDAQTRPYDDTGWTFPEAFGVQAVRITDPKVLDASMEAVKGDVKAPGGVNGAGTVFAVNHNADNALVTLRYKLKDADIQVAEEPFESGGMKFNRGSFVIKGVGQGDLDKAIRELGLKAYGLAAAPSVKLHPARAARIAVLHQWTNTQTEGWWRQAFDVYGIPYDYIDPRMIHDTPNLRAKYDVIVFGPGGGQGAVEGTPLWKNPIPYQNTSDTPNVGTWAQTEDTRIGMGLEGLMHLRQFIDGGGAFIASNSSADFAITNNFTYGVASTRPGTTSRVVGSLLRTKLVDDASPIVYGVPDNLAVYSDAGESLTVSATAGGGGRGGGGGGGGAPGGGRGGGAGGARPTGRGTPDDADVVQGRPADEATNLPPLPAPPQVQPWQYALPTEEVLKRNPANVIPPSFRPRVPLRFDAQNTLLVSGLLDGGAEIAQRPVVVDVPVGKGHVVLFAANPIYRGETIGSYFMVFNTILNFDNLDAGRKLDPR